MIELSTQDETNDDIVASWTPATPPEALKPFSYAYRLTAGLNSPRLSPNGKVVNTFTAPARALGSLEKAPPGTCRFLVDFASGDLAYYVADPSQVEVVASATNGQILRARALPPIPISMGCARCSTYRSSLGRRATCGFFLRAWLANVDGNLDISLDRACGSPAMEQQRQEPLLQKTSELQQASVSTRAAVRNRTAAMRARKTKREGST